MELSSEVAATDYLIHLCVCRYAYSLTPLRVSFYPHQCHVDPLFKHWICAVVVYPCGSEAVLVGWEDHLLSASPNCKGNNVRSFGRPHSKKAVFWCWELFHVPGSTKCLPSDRQVISSYNIKTKILDLYICFLANIYFRRTTNHIKSQMSSVLNSICIGHFFGLLEFIPVVSFFLKFVRYP